ncbi:MAG: hypothetical protein J6B77_03220, partial [Clostridia bacterium]|nr:hypothetical protein [Clostridia bacterium]
MKQLHGIRFTVLLLCLVLLVSVFVACGGTTGGDETTAGSQGGETTGGETTGGGSADDVSGLKVQDYTLIYPDGDSKAQEIAESLNAAATDAFGVAFKAIASDFVTNEAEIDPNACEILIGATNRAESASALEALNGGRGYVMKKLGNKVVINGSYATLVDEAGLRFMTEYVSTGANGVLNVKDDFSIVEAQMSAVQLLTEAGKTDFYFVIGKDVDTSTSDDVTTAGTNREDYVVSYFLKVTEGMNHKFGVTMTVSTDEVPIKSDSCEILLGRTNRYETQAFLETLAPNEYGYGVVGNKLVITGWSDLTIALAMDLFYADMNNFVNAEGGFDNFVMTEEDTKIAKHEAWDMTVPLYTGGELNGAVEGLNKSYELRYTNTTKEEYDAYCASLVAAGYKLQQNNHIGNNYYATYADAKNMIHVYYVDYEKAVRFITEPMATVILPPLTDSCEKITETTLTLMDLDNASGNFGNAFIITLEDGSFIVHDGGATTGGKDCDEMYSLLNRLNKRPDGKIVIAAWVISHEHGDHFGNFNQMIMKYYKQNVKLEKVLYNVSVDSFDYNTGNPGSYVQNGTLNKIKLATGCELIRMHTGQRIQIRNLHIEVIYTWEDIYPLHPSNFNNTAFITRFDIGEGENKQRLTILGDVEDTGSGILVNMYGDALKTDILQVAHHGWGG